MGVDGKPVESPFGGVVLQPARTVAAMSANSGGMIFIKRVMPPDGLELSRAGRVIPQCGTQRNCQRQPA